MILEYTKEVEKILTDRKSCRDNDTFLYYYYLVRCSEFIPSLHPDEQIYFEEYLNQNYGK
jgi:hypothetical protein